MLCNWSPQTCWPRRLSYCLHQAHNDVQLFQSELCWMCPEVLAHTGYWAHPVRCQVRIPVCCMQHVRILCKITLSSWQLTSKRTETIRGQRRGMKVCVLQKKACLNLSLPTSRSWNWEANLLKWVVVSLLTEGTRCALANLAALQKGHHSASLGLWWAEGNEQMNGFLVFWTTWSLCV